MNDKNIIKAYNLIAKAMEEHLTLLDIKCKELRETMHYAIFCGGKRLRPIISYLTGVILKINKNTNLKIACALEWTHNYSLIHDDLPAMDNDDFRRGKPTCHKKFNEALAILAGDALQISAIQILCSITSHETPPNIVLALINALIDASGPAGMISGQALDLIDHNHSIEQKHYINNLKTSKLIEACVTLPIIASNKSSVTTEKLKTFSKILGYAYQLQDDYMDRYNPEALGRKLSSDINNNKVTTANIFSQNELKKIIQEHYDLNNQNLEEIKQENACDKNAIHGLININTILATRHLK